MILSCIFIALTFTSAQSDTLNKLDSAGKKNGSWIIYYNETLHQVKDTNKARYYKYTYFCHGTDIYYWYTAGREKWKLVHTDGNSLHRCGIELLDGEYTWIDEKGTKREVLDFKNGENSVLTDYRSSGSLRDVWDYTMRYKGHPLSYRVSEYDNKGNVKYYWFYKNHCISYSKDGI